MIDKSGKRAVIISNIHSDSIEQAIFILKSEGISPRRSVGSGIISEAQEIINNYINTVEGISYRPRHRRKFHKPAIAAAIALTVATLIVCALFKF